MEKEQRTMETRSLLEFLGTTRTQKQQVQLRECLVVLMFSLDDRCWIRLAAKLPC